MNQRLRHNLVEFTDDMTKLESANSTPEDKIMVRKGDETIARYQEKKDINIKDFDTEEFGVGVQKLTLSPISGVDTDIVVPDNMALTTIVWNISAITGTNPEYGLLDEDGDEIYLETPTDTDIVALDLFETKTDYTLVGTGITATVTLTFAEYD